MDGIVKVMDRVDCGGGAEGAFCSCAFRAVQEDAGWGEATAGGPIGRRHERFAAGCVLSLLSESRLDQSSIFVLGASETISNSHGRQTKRAIFGSKLLQSKLCGKTGLDQSPHVD